MPRLLLVDDNPSIHKIAETLLAATPIELVCVDSASAALAAVNRGDHFDVALVDTSMAGMDGWGLLEKLRQIPSTARMPIAMMAGVLDTVDPERIKNAPIQGFLKKPVELRELGERIARLMETPVPEPAAPESAAPEPITPETTTSESAAPEPPTVEPPLPAVPKEISPFATMPAVRIDELPEYRRKEAIPEDLDDLLELTEGDLYPEATVEPTAGMVAEESLDLEELDLDSLRNLPAVPEESVPTPAPFPPVEAPAEPTPQSVALPVEGLDAIATLDRLPTVFPVVDTPPINEVQPDLPEITLTELPDLGPTQDEFLEVSTLSGLPEIEEMVTAEQDSATEIPLAALLEPPMEEAVFTPPLPPLEESLDWSDESESMLAAVEAPGPAPMDLPDAFPEELDLLSVTETALDVEAPITLSLEPAEMAVPSSEAPLVFEEAPLSTEAIVESALREFETEGPVLQPVATLAAEPSEACAEEPASGSVPQKAPLTDSRELLQAMMADPVLMDALAKAVVSRLGDQVLREIAWEVIPEVAERLPRN
jgi:CheY-like chemotaxis protein